MAQVAGLEGFEGNAQSFGYGDKWGAYQAVRLVGEPPYVAVDLASQYRVAALKELRGST
ncbi:hypothetical protein [Amycolatopsis sp. NPDC052450]|uniref:hypothetical protein n=1 Tax=Amycolatopsis sp. NPDC052450 TaxID=3363937 RepID=UPI0037CA32D7